MKIMSLILSLTVLASTSAWAEKVDDSWVRLIGCQGKSDDGMYSVGLEFFVKRNDYDSGNLSQIHGLLSLSASKINSQMTEQGEDPLSKFKDPKMMVDATATLFGDVVEIGPVLVSDEVAKIEISQNQGSPDSSIAKVRSNRGSNATLECVKSKKP